MFCSQLSGVFQKLLREVITFNEVDEDGATSTSRRAKVRLFWGGDQKALLTMLGLSAPNCKYWCVWCTIDKKDRCELSHEKFQKWKAGRTVEKLRTAGDQIEELGDPVSAKRKRDAFRNGAGAGVSRRAAIVADGELLTDITQIVPDLLHLHLRTTERVLGHYRTMLDEPQAEQLLTRLETAKLGNVTFYEKHTKKRWAVKLDGM
jgi:hypothetical protein